MPNMTLAHAAQVFQKMALHTIPTRPEDKALALRAGQRKIYERRCPTEHEVRAWWTREPRYNVALLLGPTCRLLVLNVNQKHGFDGLATLKRKGHVIPDDMTPTILTPHYGLALCFKPPDREQFPFPFKTHVVVPDYPGIELRGTGGYQVVPPSAVKATTRDPACPGPSASSSPNAPTSLIGCLSCGLPAIASPDDHLPISHRHNPQTTLASALILPQSTCPWELHGGISLTAGPPHGARQKTETTVDGRVFGRARAYYCTNL